MRSSFARQTQQQSGSRVLRRNCLETNKRHRPRVSVFTLDSDIRSTQVRYTLELYFATCFSVSDAVQKCRTPWFRLRCPEICWLQWPSRCSFKIKTIEEYASHVSNVRKTTKSTLLDPAINQIRGSSYTDIFAQYKRCLGSWPAPWNPFIFTSFHCPDLSYGL